MQRIFYYLLISCILLFSCSDAKQGDLLEIPIDIDKNNSLPLSEIAEDITAIELELTDESLINPDNVNSIHLFEKYIIVGQTFKILVFNKDGKFIRSISSRGQGPGEYTGIQSISMDEKNNRLFVNASPKIICYDLNGRLLKETRLFSAEDINYINNELLIIVNNYHNYSKGVYSQPVLFHLNDDLQVVDSCTIRDLYMEGTERGGMILIPNNLILKGNTSIYIYYGDFFFSFDNSTEKILYDTLYRFEKNHLIPDLKLEFKDDKIGKSISISNIYRSLRYIFTKYNNDNTHRGDDCFFCYDTKTGKGYNTQNGFTDDINKIEKRVKIHPLKSDTEMFYYLHTNMKPDDLEEPNPTLYIGKLKK